MPGLVNEETAWERLQIPPSEQDFLTINTLPVVNWMDKGVMEEIRWAPDTGTLYRWRHWFASSVTSAGSIFYRFRNPLAKPVPENL